MTATHNSPVALRRVVWIIAIYPLFTIAQLIGLLMTTDRPSFHHNEMLYSAIVSSFLFWAIAYGIANQRLWAWWLGVIVFGVDVLASRLEIAMQGSMPGMLWVGHFTTDTAVGWVTDVVMLPCALIVLVYLASHKPLFRGQ